MKGFLSFFFILLIMPIGHALMIVVERYLEPYMALCAALIALAGVALVFATRWTRQEGWQSLLGALGGALVWTGAVEYSFVFAARRFGVPDFPQAEGEYMLMEYSWGLLIPVILYVLFLESVRCSPILWLRRKLKLMRGPTASGRIQNYGPHVAFEMCAVLWFCYVAMLLAYDVGTRSWISYLLFILSVGGGIYTLYQLYHKRTWGTAIRYAIPTVVIVWIAVEYLGKWGFFTEPWIVLNPPIMISIILAFAFTAYLVIDNLREQKKADQG
ncbi:MAG TPA: hypothetical protein G4O02_15690 [Caldilineae bacterium]|nr:hypothetical protein [Caldilineae bacterium]